MVYRLAEQIFGTKMATSEKFQSTNNSKPLKKQVILWAFHFSLIVEHIGTSSLKLPMTPCRRTNFKMATSGKFQLTYHSKPLKIQVLL